MTSYVAYLPILHRVVILCKSAYRPHTADLFYYSLIKQGVNASRCFRYAKPSRQRKSRPGRRYASTWPLTVAGALEMALCRLD